jgi:hypothetical protein
MKSIFPFEKCGADRISCRDHVVVYGPYARSSFVLTKGILLRRPLLLVGSFSPFLSYPKIVGMILLRCYVKVF